MSNDDLRLVERV